MVITTLAHHMDLAWMYEAYRQTRKSGAVGVDEVSAEEYAAALEENLASLLDRFKTGTYYAPPVRRVEIPKGDGRSTRPIGIPTFEDKVLQRAVAMVLEAVYEQDFCDCSYGFRPGRSAHDALEALWKGLMEMRGGWVVDLDISKFFDSLDHRKLREILDRRVRDGVIRRAIDKWLKAGVMKEGLVERPASGTPQGGVISPVLANIYLHEVLDSWFEGRVKPRLRGRALMVRYADDAVLVFSDRSEAERVLEALGERCRSYGLTLHPEKTRLVPFRRPQRGPGGGGPGRGSRPGTFDFLGFTHCWARSRRGKWYVRRKTARDRMRRAIKAVSWWCASHRHWRVEVQHRYLSKVVIGHCRYYGITGNSVQIGRFRQEVQRAWRAWLNRRSQRAKMTWARFHKLSKRYPLPPAIAYRSVCRA
ncbi:MAG: group II intron reverse transcriptase/maturase [Acidobacteria bacterium]|nr:group II intron reverse transcriptase/maturase [Acidobacteriota bacterium]